MGANISLIQIRKGENDMDINFNDIMDSVNELAENAVRLAKDVTSKATQKTEDMIDISKVKMDILKIQNEIKSLKTKLGGVVYDMTVQGDTDTQVIDQYVAELKTKYDQLAALKKQQEDMKKTVVCEACKSINPKEAFFCNRCGAPLPVCESANAVEVDEEEDILDQAFNEQDVAEQAMTDGADEATAAEVVQEAKAAQQEEAEKEQGAE